MREKFALILIFTIIVMVLSNASCIDSNKANNTWGERKLSIDKIKVSNDTTGNRSEQNESIYYVRGYVYNYNPFEALDPIIKVTTYYSNGTVFEVNDTPYMNPKNIPGNDKSYYYAQFEDPDKKIAKFEVKILSAKGEY